MFHLLSDYSSLITPQHCSVSASPVELNPLSLCPALPVNPFGRPAPPIQGSWGMICGAQPWSRLLATRLKRPVWTAVTRQASALWQHLCCYLLHLSSNHPSIHLWHIWVHLWREFKALEVCRVCDQGAGWGRGWGEVKGWKLSVCLCVDAWQPSGLWAI